MMTAFKSQGEFQKDNVEEIPGIGGLVSRFRTLSCRLELIVFSNVSILFAIAILTESHYTRRCLLEGMASLGIFSIVSLSDVA